MTIEAVCQTGHLSLVVLSLTLEKKINELTGFTRMDRKYAEKYVAFIDVLGFKNLLRDEGDDATNVSRLFDTIVKSKETISKTMRFTHKRHPIKSIEEAYAKEKSDVDLYQCYDAAIKDLVIKIVSDSIVLAVPVCDDFGFTVIVDACTYIAHQLLDFAGGFFVRGAIVRGKVYFEEESVFFGEAFVRAYELEEKSCIYPRIIYEDNWEDYPYMDSFGRTLLHCGEDGWGDIDYIGNYVGTRADVWFEDHEERLSSIIECGLRKNASRPEISAKYRWVKTQVERARDYVSARQSL